MIYRLRFLKIRGRGLQIRKRFHFAALLLTTVFMFQGCMVSTAPPPAKCGIAGASSTLICDIPSEKLDNQIRRGRGSGYYLIDVEAYTKNNRSYCAGVWLPKIPATEVTKNNLDDKELESWAAFQKTWNTLKSKDFRLRDIEIYNENGRRKVLAIWQGGKYGVKFRANILPGELEKVRRGMSSQGYYLVDFEPYRVTLANKQREIRFATVWRSGSSEQRYFETKNSGDFKNTRDKLANEGYELIDFEIYVDDGNTAKYVGVWRRGRANTRLWMRDKWANFREKFKTFDTEKLFLIDLEIEPFKSGQIYSGVWSDTWETR